MNGTKRGVNFHTNKIREKSPVIDSVLKFCHLQFEINVYLFRMMAASDEPDGEVVNGSGGAADGSGGVEGGAAEVSPAAGGTSEQGGEQNGDEKQKNDDSGTNGKGAITTLMGVQYQIT